MTIKKIFIFLTVILCSTVFSSNKINYTLSLNTKDIECEQIDCEGPIIKSLCPEKCQQYIIAEQ